jgi:hypothetical protein
MDSNVSLAYSQELAIFPYSAPDCSNPRLLLPTSLYVVNPSQYYFPISALVFQVACCLQVYLPMPCMHILSPQFVLHAPSIWFLMLITPIKFDDDYRSWAPDYSICCSPLLHKLKYTTLNLVLAFLITYVAFLQSLPSLDHETQFCKLL